MIEEIEDNSSVNANLSDSSKSFQERIDEIRGLVEENLRYTKTIHDTPSAGVEFQETIQKLLKENLEISKELYEMTKKMQRWMLWQRIWTWVKILIIVVPLIIGLIYLPPILKDLLGPAINFYQEMLDLNQGAAESQNILQQFFNR